MEEVKEGDVEGEEVKRGENGGDAVRVLVVDDSPVDRKVVEMLLKRCGYMFEVIVVDSGKKAMEVLGFTDGKLDSHLINVHPALVANVLPSYGDERDIHKSNLADLKIDIILTDYFMPEMTGYDILKTVKDCNWTKSIPVVLMSSENDQQRIIRCRAAGAEDFILKPLKIQDIKRLRTYAKPAAFSTKSGTKRKLPVELLAENSDSKRERRLHLAGVVMV